MRHLFAAFAIALGSAVGVFVALSLALAQYIEFAVSGPIIASISGLPIAGVFRIAEALERRDARRSLAHHRETSVASIERYSIPWPFMAAYGSVVLMVVMHLGGGIAGFFTGGIIAYLEIQGIRLQPAAAGEVFQILHTFLAMPIVFILTYLIGRWIGTRCRGNALACILATVFGAAILSVSFTLAVSYVFQPDAMFGEQPGVIESLPDMAIYLSLLSVAVLIGYWRGRRHRVAKYMSYLLGVLPPETRQLLVHLAYEEAERVGTAPPALQPVPLQARAA